MFFNIDACQMGKYKFILVLEKSDCKDYIGKRLWQALHAGAIPIYFGAENIQVAVCTIT